MAKDNNTKPESQNDDAWTSGSVTPDSPDPDPDGPPSPDPGTEQGCLAVGPLCLAQQSWYIVGVAAVSVLALGGFYALKHGSAKTLQTLSTQYQEVAGEGSRTKRVRRADSAGQFVSNVGAKIKRKVRQQHGYETIGDLEAPTDVISALRPPRSSKATPVARLVRDAISARRYSAPRSALLAVSPGTDSQIEQPVFVSHEQKDKLSVQFAIGMQKFVRDRRSSWRAPVHKQCFNGDQAIEWLRYWLYREGTLDTEGAAVAVGTRLIEEGVIEPLSPSQREGPPCLRKPHHYRLTRARSDAGERNPKAAQATPNAETVTLRRRANDSTPGKAVYTASAASAMPESHKALRRLTASLASLANNGSATQSSNIPEDAALRRLVNDLHDVINHSTGLSAELAKQCSSGSCTWAPTNHQTLVYDAMQLKKAASLPRGTFGVRTLYTMGDRLCCTVGKLHAALADKTCQKNIDSCPLLKLLCVDSVRANVLGQLPMTDLYLAATVSRCMSKWVRETLSWIPRPLVLGSQPATVGAAPAQGAMSLSLTLNQNVLRFQDIRFERQDAAACIWPENTVFLAGGRTPDGRTELATAAFLPLSTQRWQQLPPMQTARAACRACCLRDGSTMVMGGFDGSGATASCEMLCPTAAATWRTVAPMGTSRTAFGARKLRDGRVMVVGGFGRHVGGGTRCGALQSAEVYDASTDVWTSLPDMRQARSNCGACVLPDGSFMVAGGHDKGKRLRSAEVFSFKTNRWTTLPELSEPRSDPGMCIVGGCPLVIGGENAMGGVCTTVEVFDPVRCSWGRLREKLQNGCSPCIALSRST